MSSLNENRASIQSIIDLHNAVIAGKATIERKRQAVFQDATYNESAVIYNNSAKEK